MGGLRIALLAIADEARLQADTAEMAVVMLAQLLETLRRASMDVQPRKCQRFALQLSLFSMRLRWAHMRFLECLSSRSSGQ